MSDQHEKHQSADKNHTSHDHHHFILPEKTAVAVGVALLILTVITVAISKVDLGAFNFTVALLVAMVKAALVGLVFMGLKYDRKENGLIFVTSFVFLAIFIVLTATDLLFRPGEVYVKGSVAAPFGAPTGKSQFKKAWVSTPELVAKGKVAFEQQCASCHGAGGKGDGIAGAGLNPKPRNLTAAEGWKNGRKPTGVFKTLTNGLNQMPVFGTLPSDDRWALAHYVLSLGPKADVDTAADFAALKIDPSKDDGGAGGAAAPSIPVELAIDLLAVPPARAQN
ncbi:MAG: c-type cytochrome [Bdellovibrionales bacterium]|nr:c-type cytochrome [Bdellovibrionales bacterium]